MNKLIKIDELRPIVESLNNESITYGKAIELISEKISSRLIEMNSGLSSRNRKLQRTGQRVLNFYEGFRLRNLHNMNNEEIEESHVCLYELSEIIKDL